jgi:hypothetical protein
MTTTRSASNAFTGLGDIPLLFDQYSELTVNDLHLYGGRKAACPFHEVRELLRQKEF